MLLTLLSPEIAPGTIVGSASITEAPDTLDGLGQVAVSGSAAITEAPDTVAASGTVAAGGTITGSAAIVEAPDVVSASGFVGTSGIEGVAAILEAPDRLDAVFRVTGWGILPTTPEIWTAQPDGRETCVFPQPGYGGFAATRRDGRDGQPAAVPGGDEADVTRAATPLVYGFPTRVDVILRILTPTGARVLRRLEAESAGLPGAAWWECVERESRVVVRAFRMPEVTP